MRAVVVLGSSLCLALTLAATTGCRSGGSDSSGGAGGGSGGSTSKSTGTGSSSGGAGGGAVVCEGADHTIQEVTSGTVGPGTHATLRGVVAMSRKWLVSGSTHCLWGVFVSAPGLSETGPNTGVLAISYGTDPVVPTGGTKAYCPKLGTDPTGDKIPDDVKPGDVLDITGSTSYFPTTFDKCGPSAMPPSPANTVSMRQFTTVCSVTKTGTAPVPKAHVLTASEIAGITSTSDTAFHDQWGGVKVAIENTGVVPTTDSPPAVVGQYGIITLAQGNIPVGDKMYYKAYNTTDVCAQGPTFVDTSTTFTHLEGFHYLDFCAWGLQINDKCADFAPPSPDCAKPPGGMPPITSCP